MTHILCSEAIAEAVRQGLTVKDAVDAFRSAIDNTTFGIWGVRHVTLIACDQTLGWLAEHGEFNPNDPSAPVEFQGVPYWEFPEVDEDGFAAVINEAGELVTATCWLENKLIFRGMCQAGPCEIQLKAIRFDELSARKVIASHLPSVLMPQSGRPPLVDYEACRKAVIAQVKSAPAAFLNSEGRIVQSSEKPQQMSLVRAAREWCERADPDRDPPSNDTLRKRVADEIEPTLRSLGYKTWRPL